MENEVKLLNANKIIWNFELLYEIDLKVCKMTYKMFNFENNLTISVKLLKLLKFGSKFWKFS